MSAHDRCRYDRRSVLRAGFGLGAAAAAAAATSPIGLGSGATGAGATTRAQPRLRWPDAIPYPSLPVGQYTGAFPFDHLVIVMQENHSFDNYLGMLPLSGQPKADGFRFNKRGEPINWNPLDGERMYVYHQAGAIGAQNTGSQSWNDSHQQIDGGAMDGFARTGAGSMGYYTEDDLPFYYSLANTFTLANRWFCSAPAQTYPNRRFLMAGTASGVVSTDIHTVTTSYPPNGTIWDRLSKYRISWTNYFTDAPTTLIMFDTVLKHPTNYAHIEQFYADAALGTLPAVSLVDCNMGAIQGEIPGVIGSLPHPVPTFAATPDLVINTTCESEENPEDVQLGEAFVARVVNAVMSGPAWHRTLLVWLYDEHGGYYDHVAPPAAPLPDTTKPDIGPHDSPGGYDLYGPRVPAVVVSPYARKHDVTNVVHDHTSILATIGQQWNLPALTFRDANATSLMDFLDTSVMAFSEPPVLAAPANPLPGLLKGYRGQPTPPPPGGTTPP
ncbi:MAG TPA: alkaline phosphatase family protein [Acidimicrobiales bacterium]|nr:alkaline phosphatase family protein [Acidimicrobiales bacterium]